MLVLVTKTQKQTRLVVKTTGITKTCLLLLQHLLNWKIDLPSSLVYFSLLMGKTSMTAIRKITILQFKTKINITKLSTFWRQKNRLPAFCRFFFADLIFDATLSELFAAISCAGAFITLSRSPLGARDVPLLGSILIPPVHVPSLSRSHRCFISADHRGRHFVPNESEARKANRLIWDSSRVGSVRFVCVYVISGLLMGYSEVKRKTR